MDVYYTVDGIPEKKRKVNKRGMEVRQTSLLSVLLNQPRICEVRAVRGRRDWWLLLAVALYLKSG